MPDGRVTFHELNEARYGARAELERNRNHSRACELAEQAYALLDRLEAGDGKRSDAYAGLAALARDLGDYERCDALMPIALELEAALPEQRPVILGTRELFYATFLHERGRLGEAASHATKAIESYSRGVASGNRELALLRRIANKIHAAARARPPS